MFESVEIPAGDVTLRGRIFLPDAGEGPYPVVIAHSGIGSVAEGGFPWSQKFLDAGLGVLFYDHRGLGYSDGEPRQLVDPWQFARDFRDVITHISLREDVDGDRIGAWGLSLGGMVGLFATATDSRIKAVAAMVPPVSGWSARVLFPEEELAALDASLVADRQNRARGGEGVLMITSGVRTPDGPPVMFTDEEGIEFIAQITDQMGPTFRNELMLASLDHLFEMEVAAYAERLIVPVLMILADADTVAPVEDARRMFAQIPEPKELVEYPGQHYGILLEHLPEILSRTTQWLSQQLS